MRILILKDLNVFDVKLGFSFLSWLHLTATTNAFKVEMNNLISMDDGSCSQWVCWDCTMECTAYTRPECLSMWDTQPHATIHIVVWPKLITTRKTLSGLTLYPPHCFQYIVKSLSSMHEHANHLSLYWFWCLRVYHIVKLWPDSDKLFAYNKFLTILLWTPDLYCL